jgi:N-acetylglucosaminyldiphosphoundecaprenol N-acetyl-beta-D-mannosaminyltransferase
MTVRNRTPAAGRQRVNPNADRRALPRQANETVDLLGTRLSVTSYAEVLRRMEVPPPDRGQLFAFCNVHSVMTARRDRGVRRALDGVDVAAPDGMPLVWVMRHRGLPEQPRVYGPDLMELALSYGVTHGWRHFLLGATDPTLDRLEMAAERLAPGVRIVGRFAPPYRPLTPAEDSEIVRMIRSSGANVLWVGLGMPKQELWMNRMRQHLPGVNIMGVGAAFDLLSGTVPQAPDWLQDRGLEWAYRLWREPRRLWRRYLYNNPAFTVLALAESLRTRFARHA